LVETPTENGDLDVIGRMMLKEIKKIDGTMWNVIQHRPRANERGFCENGNETTNYMEGRRPRWSSG
jgi:hypothetical protein